MCAHQVSCFSSGLIYIYVVDFGEYDVFSTTGFDQKRDLDDDRAGFGRNQ